MAQPPSTKVLHGSNVVAPSAVHRSVLKYLQRRKTFPIIGMEGKKDEISVNDLSRRSFNRYNMSYLLLKSSGWFALMLM